jgi:hypothetical protein
MSGSGTVYTYSYTVVAANGSTYVDGVATVSLSTIVDTAGNSSSAPTENTFTIDTVGPSTTISTIEIDPTKNSPIPITITFEDSVTGFTTADIIVTGGTKSVLSGTGASYSFDLTPTGDGLLTVDIGPGVAFDTANNGNVIATQLAINYDGTSPSSEITAICSTGTNGCTLVGENTNPQESYNVQSITGNASDVVGGSGLDVVVISIKDVTANKWYSGSSFINDVETFLDTTGTDTWSFNSSAVALTIDHTYMINSKAIDIANNEQSLLGSLSFKFTNAPPTVSSVTASQEASGVVNVTYDVDDIESSGTTNYLFYGVEATLNGTISDSVNSLTVSSGTNFPLSGTILIDDEIISYTSKSGNVLQDLTRGALSTTAFSHDTSTQVYIKANNVTGNGIGLSGIGPNKTIAWSARDDAYGYYSSNGVIKVVANDGSTGSMIGSLSSPVFAIDAARPLTDSSTLLINDSATSIFGASPEVVLKIQNVTGQPENENIFVQFSRNAGGTWYGANENGTLSGEGTLGSGFASSLANTGSISWPWTMQSRAETLVVRITDSFQNTSIEDMNTTEYNAPPEFNINYPATGNGGLTVSQISDPDDINFGKVKIQYSIRNIDTEGDVVPYFVTPSFNYDTGSGWNLISQGDITYGDVPLGGQVVDQNTDGLLDNKVSSSSFHIYTAYWTIPLGVETEAGQFKITLNDLGSSNNISSNTVSNLIFDTEEPDGGVVYFDAGVAGSVGTGLVTIPLPTDVSNVFYRISDDITTNSSVEDTGWVSMTSSTTIPWTFDIDTEIKTLKYQYRDSYGNTTNEITLATLAPISGTSFLVQDASNPNIPSYDMYIGWESVASSTGFASYKLEFATSTDNSTYTAYSSVGGGGMSDTMTNYYVHRNLNSSWYYKYRLGVTGTDGNTSIRAGSPVTAKPDGIQNYGEGGGGGGVATASQVENVVPSQDPTTKNVTVNYRLTDGSFSKKISPSYEARLFYNIGVTLPANAYGDNTLAVSDASKLKSSGYIQINNEVIAYSGKTGNVLTGLTRGTWPTSPRGTRQNSIFFQGTPVWIMASTVAPTTITNSSIPTGQNSSIVWTTYDESSLAGGNYSNVGIRVLVHDNQSAGSGPLSTQSDYSEIGTLDSLNLTAPTISFDALSSNGDENVSSVDIPLTLGRAYVINSTVDYTVTGTATGGDVDFTLINGTATIIAGTTSTNISLAIIEDLLNEVDENIVITLSNPTGSILGTNTVYTYTINDNDNDPEIQFTSTSSSGQENITPIDINVSIPSISSSDVTVDYTVTGTATGGDVDFTLINGTATITAGNTSTNISLAIINDSIYESNEDVVITLSNPNGAILGANTIYTYTITDNDTTPIISFTNTNESGVESVTSVDLPISILFASYQDTTVSYTVTGGTATSTDDFVLASGTATITAGTTSTNISLSIIDDTLKEINETVIVELSSPVNSTLGVNTIYTYTITDNDSLPTIAFTNTTGSNLEDVTSINIPVSISGISGIEAVVSYAVTGGTATSTDDFVLASGTATIIIGQTSVDISLSVVDDLLSEATENIVITLSSPTGATLGTNTVYTYTITDNDTDPTIAFTNTTGNGLENVSLVNIPVSLPSVSAKNSTVGYSIKAGGTATSGVDYILSSGTATINAGQMSTNISLAIIDDTLKEANETVIVELSSPVNSTLGVNTIYTYTITDNEPNLNVAFVSSNSSGFESITSEGINLTLASVSSQDVTVDYTVTGGTATGDGTDFTLANGTATITANTTTVEIPFTVVDDLLIESNETIIVTLSNPTNASLGTKTIHTYTIINNDTDTVSPTVTLNGDATISVTRGDSYTELGSIVTDNVDVGLTATITGSVNTSLIGSYVLTYTATDSSNNIGTAERTVNVVLALAYDITSTAGAGGTISPLGITAVTSTANQAYTITPEAGYGVDTLVVDGVPLASALTYTFTNVVTTHTIDVTFSLDPDVTPPVITLLGDNPMTVIKGETYVEPGVTVLDGIDGVIVPVITGSVNINSIGSYTITYTATDSSHNKSTETRIVNVEYASSYIIRSSSGSNGTIDPLGETAVPSTTSQTYTIAPNEGFKIATLVVDDANLVVESSYTFTNVVGPHQIDVTFSPVDGLPPTITILGDNPMTINTGEAFVDPGATAVDSTTNEALVVTTVGNVNNSTAGTYQITYFTSDSLGNTATAERTVNVVDISPPIISGIETPVKSANAAVIVWQTNEPATSQVIWGTATGNLTRNTVIDEVLSVYHVISLSSGTFDLDDSSNILEPTTNYFFTVKSADNAGNETESTEQTFTTTADGQVVVVSSSSNNNDNTSNLIPDITAPSISNVKVSDINAFGATISFDTNEETMSFVEYGKETTYGDTMGSSKWLTSHSIKLSGLRIGTDYHMRVTVVDKSGNSTTTEDEVFKTKYFNEVTDSLKTIDNLEQFQAEIEATIESILPSLIPPFIEKPNIVNITENGAMVTYRTNIKAYPAVSFSTDEFYNKTKDKPYDGEISDTTAEKSFSHSLVLSGLKANTKYHIMAKAFSLPQVVGQSDDIVFTTLPSKISGAIIDKKKDSFTVVWTTDEPTTSIVDYKNTITGRASRTIDNSQNTSHSIKIENLTPGTSYQVDISGLNKEGNIFEAAASLFVTTSVDVIAPVINNVKVDSALVLGRTDRIQTIISWQTDEPSTSIVYYEEGSGILSKELANKQEDLNTFTTNHSIVLTSLKPGTVYRFQVASTDSANNTVKPPIRTIITPRRTESIVDVIFKNFNETFNFINNFK